MNYHFSKPSLQLSPWVKQYWGLESCVPAGSEHIQRIVPNGLMELMFYLGDRPDSLDRNKSIVENTIISGQQREKYDLRVTGKMNLFSVTFHPQGAMMFFNIPVSEFCDQNIPLRFLIKDKTDELETRLSESSCFTDKISIVENFLLQQLKRNFKKYEADRIGKVMRCINQSKGRITIGNLASEACLSRKQFERIFMGCIGASPKYFLRIVRFQHAVFTRQRKPNTQLINLAYDCGFYDQSHMVNEFKSLSGLTPTEYFSDCDAYSDYFS